MIIDIYTQKGRDCPFCVKAIEAAFQIGQAETVIHELTKEELQEFFDTQCILERTVPQVYVDGAWVGGWTQFRRKIANEQF